MEQPARVGQAVMFVILGLDRNGHFHAVLFEGLGTFLSVERPCLPVDGLGVRLVGYQPTAVCSPSKLASFQGVRSGLGVEVHHGSFDGFGVRRCSDNPVTVGSHYVFCHAHLLFSFR
jgi:hypothetical protein